MNTSMTINRPLPWFAVLYIAVAEERALTSSALQGHHYKIIKEYLSRGTYICRLNRRCA
jgi:methylmalonyl-CoA mutase N-terminal domain/subunit